MRDEAGIHGPNATRARTLDSENPYASFQGRTPATLVELVELFGPPLRFEDGITGPRWRIRFEDGTLATVRPPNDAADAVDPLGAPAGQVTTWEVGGSDGVALYKVESMLARFRAARRRLGTGGFRVAALD